MSAKRVPRGTGRRKRGLREGTSLKDEGMARAVGGREDFLLAGRNVAFSLASDHPHHELFCDDVRWELEKEFSEDYLEEVQKVFGSIFRCYLFEATGERRRSAHPKNHGHEYRVWRLREEYRN